MQVDKKSNTQETLVFVSEDASDKLKEILEDKGQLVEIPADLRLYKAIQKHPDIRVLIWGQEIFMESQTFDRLRTRYPILEQLYKMKKLHCLQMALKSHYPETVFMNIRVNQTNIIHNMEYTHSVLRKKAEQEGIEEIHVRQGYTACNLLLLPNKRAITSDSGIYKSLQVSGYEVLKIQAGQIELETMPYGFIGGCCGVYDHCVYIHGDLNTHTDGKSILDFIESQSLSCQMIENQPLIDIGGILFWSRA